MHGHHYFRLSLNRIVQNMKIITFTNGKFFSFFEEKAFVIASRPGELYWYKMQEQCRKKQHVLWPDFVQGHQLSSLNLPGHDKREECKFHANFCKNLNSIPDLQKYCIFNQAWWCSTCLFTEKWLLKSKLILVFIYRLLQPSPVSLLGLPSSYLISGLAVQLF